MSVVAEIANAPGRTLPIGAGTQRRLAITVLCGGPSSEREISLRSGAAVAAGLRMSGHDVVEADISPADLSALSRRDLDAVFVALHGSFGEDGKVQRILEERGLAYTGSGSNACRLSMDKQAAKDVFAAHGLPTPAGRVVRAGELHSRTASDLVDQLGLPLVAKPLNGGSSICVNICRNRAQLEQSIRLILEHGDSALIEEFIEGREMTVGILEDAALPLIELRTSREFFDYVAKYAGNHTEYVFETGLDEATDAALKDLALRAHLSLGCRDFSRVDIRIDRQGRPFILEVNAIPGFTEKSLLPKAARKAGVEFPQLVDRLVAAALQRH